MCWQDIEIGRATRSGTREVSLTTAGAQVVANSPNRIGLLFCPPSNGTVYLTIETTVGSGDGFALTAGDPPIHFDLRHHGDLATRAWIGRLAVGTATMNVIEQILTGSEVPH
jgi:hypothetical protein